MVDKLKEHFAKLKRFANIKSPLKIVSDDETWIEI